jgi:UDP-3-O-[3-hydroxymyristoyl] glucosamine N-acyltransferase
MSMKLHQIVDFLCTQGMPCELEGDPEVVIHAVNTLDDARRGDISFLANPKYRRLLKTTQASAVVVATGTECSNGLNAVRTEDPYAAITALMVRLHGHRRHPNWGISAEASIAESAQIGEGANIGPHATIADRVVAGRNLTVYPGCYVASGCVLGDEVTLYPNVVIYENTVIGNRVAIHAGTVIAEDGLGYAAVKRRWVKIPQIGRVEIGDDVEIGANCTLDRATLGATVIGSGSKFSNLIAVGHGTKIGENCLFVAQVGLAGSVHVGKHVTMAGQAGVVGHITIGDDAVIGAKAGVTSNVEPGVTVLGQPAVPIADARRQFATVQRLPEMRQRLRELENVMREVKMQIDALEHPASSGHDERIRPPDQPVEHQPADRP